jgi:NTP pyrophosphatase (non-canonical NTP hydrolase)
MKDLYDLADDLREFAKERDWEKFHQPKNLAMALSVEVAELMEHYQWLNPLEIPTGKQGLIQDELADILIYLVRFADVVGVELIPAAYEKLEKNKAKYPADLVYGKSDKYTELNLT